MRDQGYALAGGQAEILIVARVTGPAPGAAGEDVIYASSGQAYQQDNPWRLIVTPC